MTLPMAEGPHDGDFARYVEQLTGGTPQVGMPPPAPGATAARNTKAPAPAQRRSATAVAKKGAPAGAGNAAAQFKLQVVLAVVMVGLTNMFMPRLTMAALIFAGALLISAVIRWIGTRKDQ